MHFEQHCQKTLELYGHRCEEVHSYLDQYYRYFRNEAHRIVLHHRMGISKVSEKCAHLYGWELCYDAAFQHVKDDMEVVMQSWNEVAPHLLFLNCREVSDARTFLLKEFPSGDFSQLEYKINY